MASIGIGLIGLGRHGVRYATHLLRDPVPQAHLAAVCRRNPEQGMAFAAQHGVRFHLDYRDLIADPAVEAVVVVTPPALTHAICLESVRAGKPLLIEKPLACRGQTAKEMADAAESAGVPLMTAHTLRFDGAIRTLKTDAAKVGPLHYVVLTNRLEPKAAAAGDPSDFGGRGALLEIGIHLIDLVRFLTDEEVCEVRCEMDRPASDGPDTRAVATLKTPRYAAILDASRVSASRVTRVEWVGGQGQMLADWSRHRMELYLPNKSVEERSLPGVATIHAMLEAFASAVHRGTSVPVTGRDGQRAVEIADACYESAERGQVIRLSPPR